MAHTQSLGRRAPPSNPAIHTLAWDMRMRLYLSDDSDEVLEQTLPPLVSDHSCCHIAEDVGTARLDSIQVAGQWGRGVRGKENAVTE